MNGIKSALISITLALVLGFGLGLAVFSAPLNVAAITVQITATVVGCGDGVIQGNEQCEGTNLGGASCTSRGFTSGTLSCTSACTFNTSVCVTTSSSGGGGGSSGGSSSSPYVAPAIPGTPVIPKIPDTNVVFSGRAYPFSRVGILKDGQLVVTTIAGEDSNFTATISGLSTGDYTFAAYAEDKNNIRSSLATFAMHITAGVTTKIGDIFIAPTIAVDKNEVKSGDIITIFGQSIPKSKITIIFHSEKEFFVRILSDVSGAYSLKFDTSVLKIGLFDVKSKVTFAGEESPLSKVVNFTVSKKNIFTELFKNLQLKADLNDDDDVNLIDFSIAAYWYKRELSDAFKALEAEQLNGDGTIDLVDFSMMAFYWTG